MRKPDYCICEIKGADHLHCNCAANQHLCFVYIESTSPILPKSEISGVEPSSMTVQPGLCRPGQKTQRQVTLRKLRCSSYRHVCDDLTMMCMYFQSGICRRDLWSCISGHYVPVHTSTILQAPS